MKILLGLLLLSPIVGLLILMAIENPWGLIAYPIAASSTYGIVLLIDSYEEWIKKHE